MGQGSQKSVNNPRSYSLSVSFTHSSLSPSPIPATRSVERMVSVMGKWERWMDEWGENELRDVTKGEPPDWDFLHSTLPIPLTRFLRLRFATEMSETNWRPKRGAFHPPLSTRLGFPSGSRMRRLHALHAHPVRYVPILVSLISSRHSRSERSERAWVGGEWACERRFATLSARPIPSLQREWRENGMT